MTAITALRDRHAHVALVNVPLHGHVNPTLSLAGELVSRGHRVSYATAGEFADEVTAVGATPVLPACPRLRWNGGLDRGFTLAAAYAAATLTPLVEAFRNDPPDVVLHDVLAFAGPALAARWRVPSMMLAPTHVPYQGWQEDMAITEEVINDPQMTRFAEACAVHGIPVHPDRLLRPPARAIAFFPRAFQRNAATLRGQCTFVGPTTAAAPPAGLPAPVRDGRRTVLITLGTLYHGRAEFYRACLDGLADLPWRVIMAVGPELNPARLGPVPGNVSIHARVPQADILATADAFITHAGMGGTMEALSHAVPLVAVPQMPEQRVNAQQIAALNLGVHLPPEQATPSALRNALTTVTTDPAIARGTADMREQIRHCGGARAAALAVEELLARSLRPRPTAARSQGHLATTTRPPT
ncbi:macrolide family glycosyltransferase [Streptomyces sp. NPDC050803]|uniref:macrolide family glycosyltransferase n=1 Tax=unclassified Streptomyces TaxID=2593676 RepID=UPI003419DBBB